MANAPMPDADTLRKLLRYDPDTGRLEWLWRDVSWFSDGVLSASHAQSIWNGKNAGKEAFTADTGKGYRQGQIFNNRYEAHRVIWAMVSGEPCKGSIDHINGNASDNRWDNLREVSQAQNMRNQKTPMTNRSGRIGVYRCNTFNKWVACIQFEKRNRGQRYFVNFDEAVRHREALEKQYDFHENHGRGG